MSIFALTLASVIAIDLNPLALVQLRASADVQVALAPHHAAVLSPFHTSRYLSVRGGDTQSKRPSFGGELGYRYMFGKRSFDGPFAGVSFLFERIVPGPAGSYDTFAFGGAVDLGIQTITSSGIVLGAGAGVQWTVPADDDLDVTATGLLFSQTGLYPRVLAFIGYGF